MQVGCFGDVVFCVSDEKVLTPKNISWTNKARLGSHQIHMGTTKLEFTGVEEASISHEIILLRDLGVEPMDALSQLLTYLRTGYEDSWIMGGHQFGTGGWCIESLQTTDITTDATGRIMAAKVKVTLKATGEG